MQSLARSKHDGQRFDHLAHVWLGIPQSTKCIQRARSHAQAVSPGRCARRHKRTDTRGAYARGLLYANGKRISVLDSPDDRGHLKAQRSTSRSPILCLTTLLWTIMIMHKAWRKKEIAQSAPVDQGFGRMAGVATETTVPKAEDRSHFQRAGADDVVDEWEAEAARA